MHVDETVEVDEIHGNSLWKTVSIDGTDPTDRFAVQKLNHVGL
jgi:hypothetical protein